MCCQFPPLSDVIEDAIVQRELLFGRFTHVNSLIDLGFDCAKRTCVVNSQILVLIWDAIRWICLHFDLV